MTDKGRVLETCLNKSQYLCSCGLEFTHFRFYLLLHSFKMSLLICERLEIVPFGHLKNWNADGFEYIESCSRRVSVNMCVFVRVYEWFGAGCWLCGSRQLRWEGDTLQRTGTAAQGLWTSASCFASTWCLAAHQEARLLCTHTYRLAPARSSLYHLALYVKGRLFLWSTFTNLNPSQLTHHTHSCWHLADLVTRRCLLCVVDRP